MKFFSPLKNQAESYLAQYKQGNPASYAAAEQALGALLITDGLIGIDNPFGGRKRPGIFGAIFGIAFGIVLAFIPGYFGKRVADMSATTQATVQDVIRSTSSSNDGTTCSLAVQYTVDGQQYNRQSTYSSSTFCGLSKGQTITINYNPSSPASWVYGAQTIKTILRIVFWVGILVALSSAFTALVRLFSIIFGWKLLKDGRKNAAQLPAGTNAQSMVSEIKKNFVSSVFNFGGGVGMPTAQAPAPAPSSPTDTEKETPAA